jgi:MFS family permease
MTLGAFISSALIGIAAKKFGRRQCLWAACVLCCVANVIMMATTNIGALYLGRLLIGLANGYLMTASQLYIQECSPPQFRGLFLSGFQFFTSFGTLIGTIINWATAKRDGRSAYLIPLGLIYVVPVFILIGMFFVRTNWPQQRSHQAKAVLTNIKDPRKSPLAHPPRPLRRRLQVSALAPPRRRRCCCRGGDYPRRYRAGAGDGPRCRDLRHVQGSRRSS